MKKLIIALFALTLSSVAAQAQYTCRYSNPNSVVINPFCEYNRMRAEQLMQEGKRPNYPLPGYSGQAQPRGPSFGAGYRALAQHWGYLPRQRAARVPPSPAPNAVRCRQGNVDGWCVPR